jgi:alkanesulfonate monooxygenase SsuD/methylene tetrahydromethanopterin reductase-like flavin-dependent oxidoreductase (luciferase family)
VKLDLLYEIDVPRPWGTKGHPYDQRAAEQKSYYEAMEQIKFADKLGYNTVWVVEHHFREGRSHCPSSEVVLGALSQCTEQIKMGFGVTLTPFNFIHPARVAEKVATVDILSKGRVEWGTGRSTPMEQTAFHVDREKSRDEWREAIEIICGMWREEYFEYESDTFSFPRRMQTPKPFQDPHPPAWMAATSQSSAEVAGHAGLGMLSFTIMQPIEMMGEAIRLYRQAQSNVDPLTDVVNNRVAAYTLVHAGDSMETVQNNGLYPSLKWWYENLAQFTIDWEFPNTPQEEVDRIFPLMKPLADGNIPIDTFNDADMIVTGDADRCYEKMKHYADLGVDQLLCYMQFGFLEHEDIMKSLEIIGKEVLPEIENYVPPSDSPAAEFKAAAEAAANQK